MSVHISRANAVNNMRERPRELEPVVDVVDHDDAAGPDQPRGFRGEQTDRTGTEHDDDIPFLDLAELRAE